MLLSLIVVVVPIHTFTQDEYPKEPYTQKFLITAYYSPEPRQCCYVRGSYKADQILNGQGFKAADETPVYPGMIAAPQSYRFGTTITLPGFGTFKVHDRGGAIVERGDGVHRLDLWVGHGEEGLARALALGAVEVTGTVYPVGTTMPTVSFDLATLPAPHRELQMFFIERENLLALKAEEGDRGLSVTVLQDHLRDLGYFGRGSTGFFGGETKTAFQNFLSDFALQESASTLTENAAAHLKAAHRRREARNPIRSEIDGGASAVAIAEAQRILRFLGFYRGRTDGTYSGDLIASILDFQFQNGIIASGSDRGAGRIGPATMKALRHAWNKHHVAVKAGRYKEYYSVDQKLHAKGRWPNSFLEEHYRGSQVRLLQELLAERGFFEEDMINGNFGPKTKEAVMAFQLDRDIIESADHPAAGMVGPGTLKTLRSEERNRCYRIVRREGWGAL